MSAMELSIRTETLSASKGGGTGGKVASGSLGLGTVDDLAGYQDISTIQAVRAKTATEGVLDVKI
jgi:hypothetical protein